MFKEKLARRLIASTLLATLVSGANAAGSFGTVSANLIVEEMIVYGTDTSDEGRVDSDVKANMSAHVEALNRKQKRELDAAFSRLAAPSLRIAAARLPARG